MGKYLVEWKKVATFAADKIYLLMGNKIYTLDYSVISTNLDIDFPIIDRWQIRVPVNAFTDEEIAKEVRSHVLNHYDELIKDYIVKKYGEHAISYHHLDDHNLHFSFLVEFLVNCSIDINLYITPVEIDDFWNNFDFLEKKS